LLLFSTLTIAVLVTPQSNFQYFNQAEEDEILANYQHYNEDYKAPIYDPNDIDENYRNVDENFGNTYDGNFDENNGMMSDDIINDTDGLNEIDLENYLVDNYDNLDLSQEEGIGLQGPIDLTGGEKIDNEDLFYGPGIEFDSIEGDDNYDSNIDNYIDNLADNGNNDNNNDDKDDIDTDVIVLNQSTDIVINEIDQPKLDFDQDVTHTRTDIVSINKQPIEKLGDQFDSDYEEFSKDRTAWIPVTSEDFPYSPISTGSLSCNNYQQQIDNLINSFESFPNLEQLSYEKMTPIKESFNRFHLDIYQLFSCDQTAILDQWEKYYQIADDFFNPEDLDYIKNFRFENYGEVLNNFCQLLDMIEQENSTQGEIISSMNTSWGKMEERLNKI